MAKYCATETVPSQVITDIENGTCALDSVTTDLGAAQSDTNAQLIAAYAAMVFPCNLDIDLLHQIKVGAGFPDFVFTLGDIINTPGWIEAVGVNVVIDEPSVLLQTILDLQAARQSDLDELDAAVEELTETISCNACE